MKNRYLFLIVLVMIICSGSFSITAQNPDWTAPANSNGLKNPFVGNAKATTEGKAIYNQICVLCHGVLGKGNGEAG